MTATWHWESKMSPWDPAVSPTPCQSGSGRSERICQALVKHQSTARAVLQILARGPNSWVQPTDQWSSLPGATPQGWALHPPGLTDSCQLWSDIETFWKLTKCLALLLSFF